MYSSSEKKYPRCIGLITDFGLSDPYVGQLKGVLAQRATGCRIIDISHDVSPFNVAQAGFFLATSCEYFPKNAVILTVVDPGVGTKRKIICLQIKEQLLIAPDNGLLGLVMKKYGPENIRVFDLSAAMDGPEKSSHTFHGRDILAPLAARLALGDSLESMGVELSTADLAVHDCTQPTITQGLAKATILHIDHFGNCVLSLETGSLDNVGQILLVGLSKDYLTCAKTYANLEKGAPGLLDGSQGYLEIAVNQHSAADKFGLSMGDEIELKWEV